MAMIVNCEQNIVSNGLLTTEIENETIDLELLTQMYAPILKKTTIVFEFNEGRKVIWNFADRQTRDIEYKRVKSINSSLNVMDNQPDYR